MRYSLLNMYGERVGIEDTDDLREALSDAREFEYSIYDNELQMLAYGITPGIESLDWKTNWVLARERS